MGTAIFALKAGVRETFEAKYVSCRSNLSSPERVLTKPCTAHRRKYVRWLLEVAVQTSVSTYEALVSYSQQLLDKQAITSRCGGGLAHTGPVPYKDFMSELAVVLWRDDPPELSGRGPTAHPVPPVEPLRPRLPPLLRLPGIGFEQSLERYENCFTI